MKTGARQSFIFRFAAATLILPMGMEEGRQPDFDRALLAPASRASQPGEAESEVFLRREIEFAAAAEKPEVGTARRLTLYKLLIARYFSPRPDGGRSPDISLDVSSLADDVVLPELAREFHAGNEIPPLLDEWKLAFLLYLGQRHPGSPEENEEKAAPFVRKIKSFDYDPMKLIQTIPLLAGEEARMFVVHAGLRYVVQALHHRIGTLDEKILPRTVLLGTAYCLRQMRFPNLEAKMAAVDRIAEQLTGLLWQEHLFIPIPDPQDERGELPWVYSVRNTKTGQVYKIIPVDWDQPESHAELRAESDFPLYPEEDLQIADRGVVTLQGKILLNPLLHDNGLDLLRTWTTQLFHLKWFYTLKSKPVLARAWTHRMIRHRAAWEEIERGYADRIAGDEGALADWERSPLQRRVNAALGRAAGLRVLRDTAASGSVPEPLRREFEFLTDGFGISADPALSPGMRSELQRWEPFLSLVESHPQGPALLAEALSDPVAHILHLDASYTEPPIPFPRESLEAAL